MHQSILALLIPPGPGNPRVFVIFSLPGGRALHGTCKVVDRGRGVYRPGICLDRTFLRQTRVIKEFLKASRFQETASGRFELSCQIFVERFRFIFSFLCRKNKHAAALQF